ncbi:MAG: hypothetical protein MRY49_01840 [Candidatus Pacebacteria bacterium]|nr:hypothetical protein [Candidatus Paceibacterota bacterium]
MATLNVSDVTVFLSAADETGISLTVLGHHLRRIKEQGVCEKQLTLLHRSGVDSDFLEAVRAGNLENVDRAIFRHVLGLSPKGSVVVTHSLNTADDPYTPNNWSIEEHDKSLGTVTLEKRSDGELYLNGRMVTLYLDPEQEKGTVGGHKLRERLKGKMVLNATILDYLRENPELIPDSWKGKSIFFWGTVYCDSGGYLYVRFLYWNDDAWSWNYYWLDGDWRADNPSACLAS